jgi:N-acyl-D-amino-acid deacylase
MTDLVIKNALIVDGTGKTAYSGDVAVTGSKISDVGSSLTGRRIIDASDMVVAPGFVDIHSHSDYTILIDNRAQNKILQGVTCEVTGNCGYSAAPMAGPLLEERRDIYGNLFGLEIDWTTLEEYRNRADSIAVNIAPLVGHNTIRASAMGVEDREPTEAEMKKMAAMLNQALDEGAFGLSCGLIYPPSCYSNTEELVSLVRLVTDRNRVFTCHIRSEGDRLVEAIREMVDITQKTGVSMQISHLKTSCKRNWSKLDAVFDLIETAQSRGLPITCDRYPYLASNTGLKSVLPHWVFEGGNDAELARLRNPDTRKKIESDIENDLPGQDYWEQVIISQVTTDDNRFMEGKSVAEGAKTLKKDPYTFLFDLLLAEKMQVEAILFIMCEENLRRILTKPYVMIGSDSGGRAYNGILAQGKPHPRAFGTFPMILGRYVREKKLLTLEEAIRKMTGAPCEKMGIADRGVIRPGAWADLVVFDPEKIADRSQYGDPFHQPAGISYVVVNGQIAVDKGGQTGVLAGKILRRV